MLFIHYSFMFLKLLSRSMFQDLTMSVWVCVCVCVCEVRARGISLIGIIILFQIIDIADPIRVAISISIIWLQSQKCERTGWEQDNRNSDGPLYPSIHRSWFSPLVCIKFVYGYHHCLLGIIWINELLNWNMINYILQCALILLRFFFICSCRAKRHEDGFKFNQITNRMENKDYTLRQKNKKIATLDKFRL